MRKLFSLFMALLATTSLWAYDFQVGDLCYNITSSSTVEVTYQQSWSSSNYNYSGLTTATIPETVTYNGTTYSVTSIGDDAFYYCFSLTSITIPNSVTSIGGRALFYCSSLTSVTIPNSVTSIGGYAFASTGIYNDESNWENDVLYIDNCLIDAKDSISGTYTIKENTRLIAASAFSYCHILTSITIPEGVTSIGAWAFNNCSSLTSITIPNSVTSIGDYAFQYCSSLTSVTIGNSVTSIGDYAFQYCSSLTSVTIGNSVTSIGDYAFQSCSSLTSITIPNSVTSIGEEAFDNCSSLTSVTIGNSVTSIGDGAFDGCSALREITLPASLKNIGSNAFAGTPRLYEVTCLAPEPPIAEESSFTNYDAYFHAYCDAQRYYSVDPVWKKFHNVECIVNENTVTNNVTITPSDCEATVVWLSNDAAAAYSLVITKNGITFSTLRFNKYGQLTNIAFAPSRTHNNKQQAAEATSTGYSFTITGLDAGTRYDYQFSVLNDSNESVDEYFGEFTTQGNAQTATDNIPSSIVNTCKLLRNGQLIILRDGVEYNAIGQEL